MSPEKMSKRQEQREKVRKQQARNRLAMVAVITVAAILLVFAFVRSGPISTANQIVTVAPAILPQADGLTLGDPNSPVTIDVFEDFQCPACRYFTESIESLIIQNLVTPGKAKYTFHNYPFIDGNGITGGESDQAANAAMCANEQGKFWEMHSILFANWNGENKGNLSDVHLKAMAEAIGLEMNSFNACFDANKYKDAIQADFQLGNDMGASGTPSVFVNGQKLGQPGKIATYQEIADAVELAINSAP